MKSRASETHMKYEDGSSCRGTFSDPRKGDNAKGDEEQDRQQGRRNRHGMEFRAKIGTGCCSRDGRRSHCIQKGRCRPNESQHLPGKLHEIYIVSGKQIDRYP